jgi:hypothetical protein
MFTIRISGQTVRRCTVAAAVCCFSLATPVPATAERSWDIDVYDQCIEQWVDVKYCCVKSDGDLTQGQPPKCVAPAANQAENAPGTPPPTPNPRPRPPAPATVGVG